MRCWIGRPREPRFYSIRRYIHDNKRAIGSHRKFQEYSVTAVAEANGENKYASEALKRWPTILFSDEYETDMNQKPSERRTRPKIPRTFRDFSDTAVHVAHAGTGHTDTQ